MDEYGKLEREREELRRCLVGVGFAEESLKQVVSHLRTATRLLKFLDKHGLRPPSGS